MTLRREKQDYFSMFISSADDCNDYRSAVSEVVKTINIGAGKELIKVFNWKTDVSVKQTNMKFQDRVYHVDAPKKWGKQSCDIFLLLCWHQYGKYTIEEYDYYHSDAYEKIAKSKPVIFPVVIDQAIKPNEIDSASFRKLQIWLSREAGGWVHVGKTYGAVSQLGYFRDCLSQALDDFLNEEI